MLKTITCLSFATFAIFTTLSFAQFDKSTLDDFMRSEEVSRDYFSYDITENMFLGETNGADFKWNSIGVNINLMADKQIGVNEVFSIGYGIRFAFNNMRSNAYMNIIDSIGATRYDIIPDSLRIDKHKFTTNFFEIPLELRFRFYMGEKSYRVTLGGVVGFRMRSFERWRDGDLRFKEYNHPDVARLRYGGFLRIGGEHTAIYVGYYANPVFKNSASSQLNLLNFGINFAI
jgi:hypothetical protein